jgi:tetratricopeptide (TPR) repeat protein
VLLLLARYLQLYVHDVHHLFPPGARRWQTKMLAAVLVLSPLLLQIGWVPLIFTLLFACALYATAAEVAISCILLALLALSPFAAEGLARLAAFGGPAVDVWMLEHGEGSPAELARLQRRLDLTPELPVAFALARKSKRDGDLPAAEKLYQRALETSGASSLGLASAHNNLGNVFLLEGDAQKAMQHYQSAAELQDSLAAPHFNMSRALGLGGVETLEKVQAEQARALELDRDAIDAFTGGQLQANKKSNRFVMDVGLDDAMLAPLLEAEARIAAPVGDELRAQLAGPLPAAAASALPLFAAVAFLLLHSARGKLRQSGRCERCGREVCKRCDPDARPSESLCAQCVNVFIRRTGVEPAERLRKEFAVQAYHRRRTAAVRVLGLLSGAGHVLMGYPLRGILFLLMTCSLIASVLLWRGLAHEPVAVRSTVSLFRVGVTIACFVAVYAVCLRDLVNRQRAEGA